MPIMKNFSFLIILFLMLLWNPTEGFGCSIVQVPPPPMSEVSTKSFIFVGEITGYTKVIRSGMKADGISTEAKFYGEGKGYKIKPVESINLPIPPKDYYELFTFGVTTWCAPQINNADLPVGTKVRLVA